MSKENTDKNEHGANGIESLEQMISSLKGRDYIVNAQKRYRIADPEYGEEQFYFQFLIEFSNHDQWILHHTTSIRDRIAEQQWHSEHIKRLNENVEKAYVVVPDGMEAKESNIAQNYNDKIEHHRIFSALDGVVPLGTIYRMIEYKAAGLLEAGQAKAKLGLHFEEKLVDSLNNQQNLEKWKGSSSTAVGYLYSLFEDVMKALGIKRQELILVSATSDIPKLPSGGSPKTDVLVELSMSDGTKKDYTFSCKRSSADRVSVHEYTADAFSNVLNPDDNELRSLLLEFQAAGGIKKMQEEHAKAFSQRLRTYDRKLSEWVLSGAGGEGDPKIQWASHIIVLNENTNTYKISTIDEYIRECEDKNAGGQFGTLFQWTYPSGGLGKRIQLKMKVE